MNNRSSRNRTDTVLAGTLQSCKKNWLFDSRRRRKKDVTAKRGSPGGRSTARTRPHTVGRSSAEPPPKDLKRRLACGCAAGILFAGNLFAKDGPRRHDPNTDSRSLDNPFGPAIQIANWATFGSPVASTMESTPGYKEAELFAGPHKFSNSGDGDYFPRDC